MCGLAGLIGWPPAEADRVIRPMVRSLAHRGPDGEGVWSIDGVAFGHRRLSILDLSSAGDQPMTAHDERYSLIFNGQVYNFAALRRELAALGHSFRSRSDTEVVLHSLIQWGPEAVKRFNGMFALAFYDTYTKTLLLARDRYGIKPLYVWQTGDRFAFASESKAFLGLPGFGVSIDRHGLSEYLNFQNFFSDHTLFDGVRMFKAGHIAQIRLGRNGEVSTSVCDSSIPFWDFNFEEPASRESDEDYLEELDRLFRQAVELQMVADVPVNAYLSGGLDTGGITAIAALNSPRLRTFTIGFDMSSAGGMEQGTDERHLAERVSYLCGTEQYEMVLKAGDMERCMRSLIHALEEPRVGQCYPNFYAARLASKYGKVVLSGTGGDELFAGYPWRYFRPSTAPNFEAFMNDYFGFWQRLIPPEVAGLPLLRGAEAESFDARAAFRNVFPDRTTSAGSPVEFINQSLYFEAKTFLHGLLVVDDKLSMAHSLEGRFPLLDNDLVDFAMRLPMSLKLANLQDLERVDENTPGGRFAKYEANHTDGKLLLRRLVGSYLGEQATLRKQGFSGPDASWFRGESLDYVRRTLNPKSTLFDVLEPSIFLPLLEDHLEGRVNRRLLVWSLLSLQTWLDVFT